MRSLAEEGGALGYILQMRWNKRVRNHSNRGGSRKALGLYTLSANSFERLLSGVDGALKYAGARKSSRHRGVTGIEKARNLLIASGSYDRLSYKVAKINPSQSDSARELDTKKTIRGSASGSGTRFSEIIREHAAALSAVGKALPRASSATSNKPSSQIIKLPCSSAATEHAAATAVGDLGYQKQGLSTCYASRAFGSLKKFNNQPNYSEAATPEEGAVWELALPYIRLTRYRFALDEETRSIHLYSFLLTINFKKRSLYVGLNTPRRHCIFSFTSGMFLPNYISGIHSKDFRKKQLEYLRGLKHKEKKLVKKKATVLRWKCNRYRIGTKLYMLRYINILMKLTRLGNFVILVRGVPKNVKRFVREIFRGCKKVSGGVRELHINYVVFSNKFEHTLSLRAVKKRLRKSFQSRSK